MVTGGAGLIFWAFHFRPGHFGRWEITLFSAGFAGAGRAITSGYRFLISNHLRSAQFSFKGRASRTSPPFQESTTMASLAEAAHAFTSLPVANPTPADVRAGLLANPGFGTQFTDHMVVIEYTEGRAGTMPPSARASPSRSIRRPACCITRRKSSRAEGLRPPRWLDRAVPARGQCRALQRQRPAPGHADLPEELFVEAVKQIVRADRDWIRRRKAPRSICAPS
jgi:hypothetical protein